MLSIKKLALPAILSALALASCTKSDTTNRCLPVTATAPASEVTALQTELNAKGISAVGDNRGFFYIITREGDTTKRPTVCSLVTVSYTLRYLNGTQVEAGNNFKSVLTGLIPGWQEGVPLIGKGGYITLYLPPSLAYPNGTGTVPANTNLAFQIDLVNVE
jgi:FKBP-type peptidyl-prolyl cis-trans isomerase FkpA